MEGLFVLEDVHNIGPHYRPTLLAWWERFNAGYAGLDHEAYDERFYRMWRFYLLSAAGAVAARESQLWQLVRTVGEPPLETRTRCSYARGSGNPRKDEKRRRERTILSAGSRSGLPLTG